jgi:hypothetical protein
MSHEVRWTGNLRDLSGPVTRTARRQPNDADRSAGPGTTYQPEFRMARPFRGLYRQCCIPSQSPGSLDAHSL